jgi:hypothetical protein
MNELAQAVVIATVSDGPMKWMINAPANRASAQAVLITLEVCGKHALATDRAHLPLDGLNAFQALRAYRQPRDIQQRQATEAAIGWKEGGEQACGGAMNPSSEMGPRAPRNNRRPAYFDGNPASPDSVLATAEDCLLATRGQNEAAARTALLLCSIAVRCASRQRSVWKREPPLPSWV